MRVESTKTNQDTKPNQNVKNTESVFQTTPNADKISNALTTVPTTGAFEKIMKETREQSGKDEKTASKSENNSKNSEKSEAKKSGEKDVVSKDELKEREGNKGSKDGEGSGDENENAPMFAALGVFSNGKNSAESSTVPAARSILHVADLERIVSTIRTIETKNSQQVLIELKNSVLEGLQIKITVDENGKLKAEFIALNEKIKEQMNARKGELSEIFKNRGVKFTNLEIYTKAETQPEQKETSDSVKLKKNSF